MAKLQDYKEKYEAARTKYAAGLQFYKDNQEQYEGKRKAIVTSQSAKEPLWLYNFTKELIESQVDANIPMPKVDSNSISDKKRERASIIEALIRTELTRLKFTELNDLDERVVKTASIDFALIEWDELVSVKTEGGETAGAASIKLINPVQLIPQPGVDELEKMDYFFLTFEDTKARIKAKYGKDVTLEDVAPDSGKETDTDSVTQVVCFFKNTRGRIGCVSWAGDTELINNSNYNARNKQTCKTCGSIKTAGAKTCSCGSSKWEKALNEYEELQEDIQTPFGIIPAMDYAMENGEYLTQEVEKPVTDPMTGAQMYEQVFDGNMYPIGEEPLTEVTREPYMEPTKIPYYVPKEYPVAMRKNISLPNTFRGDSDTESIWILQDSMNKLLTKAELRGINSGTIVAKLKSVKYNPSNQELAVLECDNIQDLNGIKPINVQFDTSQIEAMAMAKYNMAKSVLGITETSQGKPDSTATSGVAKEVQVARAEGRMQSKKTMKEAFYSDIFKRIFQYYLAYSDEPRTYVSTDEQGQTVEKKFSRYDFLDQDKNGEWYYDDDFNFSIDPTGSMFSNKQFQLEDMRADVGLGMYGEPNDPNAKLMYWKNKANLGYPNSKVMVAYWQDIIDRQEQQMQGQIMQQQMMGVQMIPQEMGGMMGM